MSAGQEILFERRGSLALVTLNRPKALNALTLSMIRAFQPQLEAWSADDAVRVIAIRGAGDRAFCAGGDVRAVYEAGRSGGRLTREFFREEYILNRTIFKLGKPYVALINGITMGGGVGLSVHGSHRIAGERTLLAMPETAIGLFPDVGGSYFLPRLPGQTGIYLALTGARIKAADCRYLGIATHYLADDRQEELIEALAGARYGENAARTVDEILDGLDSDPGTAPLAAHREAIDLTFASDSVEGILEALRAANSDWAREQLAILESRSPTSMKVSLEQLRRGARLDFDDCMTMEYRLSQACMAGHDFYEGIRAVLVDKDHKPQWRPATLAEVTPEVVESYFAPLGERELRFDD